MTALKVFLFNYKVTLVSPESYYSGCSMTCPHDGCDHPLNFLKVNWKWPRLVLGITAENEVVIPLVYQCSGPGKHKFKTIDPDYLAKLPTYVQSQYNYSTNDAIVFNSKDAWALLTHQTLEPVYRIVRNSRQFEFADRVERYALFVYETRLKCAEVKFPKPPEQPHQTGSGSKLAPYLNPSEKLIREIRQAAVIAFKPELDASMKAVIPGTRFAIDTNYRNTSKTKSNSNCMTTVLAKDGIDKGKCMGYSIHSGGESHEKSAEMYKGIAQRPGYGSLKACCIDKCCDGRCATTLNQHPVKEIFQLDHAPNGDIFHSLEAVTEHTNDSSLSATHLRDLTQVFFRDVASTADMDSEYPGWIQYFDYVKLDGSMSDSPMLAQLDQPPDLYARKLIALAKTFKVQVESNANIRAASTTTRKRLMLKAAIDFIGGKHCKYVPKRYRPKNEMIEEFEKFCKKWYGLTSAEIEKERCRIEALQDKYSSSLWEDSATCSLLDEAKLVQLRKSCAHGFAISAKGDRYILLRKGADNVDFADQKGVAWLRSSRPAFANSLVFKTGADKKVLGKPSIVKAVTNLSKHIHKGCFDLHDDNYGLCFYQDVGSPVSKGPRKRLVAIETSIGQNELEAHFRSMNHATATTLSLADPELEARLSFGFLNQNFNVDVKNQRVLPPNATYWRFNRSNEVIRRVFGSRLWHYRDPMDQDLSDEPHLGYGSFRYETAVLNNDTPEVALEYAQRGFPGSQTKNRWTFCMAVNFPSPPEEAHSPSGEQNELSTDTQSGNPTTHLTAHTSSPPASTSLPNSPSPALSSAVQATTTSSAGLPVQTQPPPIPPQSTQPSQVPPPALVPTHSNSVVTSTIPTDTQTSLPSPVNISESSNVSLMKAKTVQPAKPALLLKRKRVDAPCSRSNKTPRIGTKNSLIKQYFTAGAPKKKDEPEIRQRIAAVVASSADQTSTTKICEEVARGFNSARLSSTTAVSGQLINGNGVAKVMAKCASGAAASETLRSSTSKGTRNAYKSRPIESLYPVKAAELAQRGGITTNRAVRVLRHMKSWTAANCSQRRGRRGQVPKGVSNGSKALVNYGLRVVFQRMQLLELDFKSDRFLPTFSESGFWFGELVDGEIKHHSRNTRLDSVEICQKANSETK